MFWKFKKSKIKLDSLGLIADPRPVEEQQRDYQAKEIFAFAPVDWKEKPESEWRKFEIFDQDGSGSCVSQAVAKALGIENFIEENKFVRYSARDIYSQRSNKPSLGMWIQNGMHIAFEKGASFEQLMPSEGKGEEAMNNDSDRKSIDQQISLVGKGGNYLELPTFFKGAIEEIASVIESTGKCVVLGVYFGSNEWDKIVPEIKGTNTKYGHAIAATNAILYNGKKALVIEDSWAIDRGLNGRRILTEDWFGAGRVSCAYYFESLKNTWRDSEPNKPKPHFRFEKDLCLGNQNEDIKNLQKILKYEELFPQTTNSTGYYGGITAAGVYEFQKKYKVAGLAEIESVKGTRVGSKTRAYLNEKYGS